MRGISHLALVGLCVACLAVATVRAQDTASAKRDAAQQQFDRAESLRTALESQSAENRTEKSYLEVVQAYRRVYYITAHAQEVPAALFAVGSLYRAMGDRFDKTYYQSAVDAYQFLLHDYPTNRYREDAMLAVGEIARDDLHDAALARKTYEDFLTLHPHSDSAPEARQALAAMDAEAQSNSSAAASATTRPTQTSHPAAQKSSPAPATTASTSDNEIETQPSSAPSAGTTAASDGASGSVAEVTRIQTWNADTYTRIVIDVGAPVKYQSARIPGPDRIYFDLDHAHLDPSLLDKAIDIGPGGFLKGVRVAQNQDSVVRVVLEVNQVKNYSVFLLDHPSRIVVDVYGASDAQSAKNSAPRSAPEAPPETSRESSSRSPARLGPYVLASPDLAARTNSNHSSPRTAPASESASDSPSESAAVSATSPAATSAAVSPATTAMPQPIAKSRKQTVASMRPPSIPEPMRDGQASLTRVLGLKVGRIVIDAGHGGHDTGTIGPTGLLEKDLCLDVALRLGALISQRLPGAEVIYTRDDDTFVPLEQRTAIATEAKADLFISIHANSSPDPSARGIETYYLNFTNSPSALQVAARENATFDGGVHDLQDMLRKIAQNEKIDESRDLAEDIQGSLSKRMELVNTAEKDRGVRTAPFVVLIGANIPSVLAEIGFISNPADEKMMKKPDARERVAEGLYQGIASYLQSTNSLAATQAESESPSAPLPLARARH
ncbi:MAG: N-acetylmuramoyl-L-alanine amidase, partial [Candidatus Acidiferrales bacterium]